MTNRTHPLAAATAALTALTSAILALSCDPPPLDQQSDNTILRLIPERTTVSTSDETVLIVVELTTPASDGGEPDKTVIYVHASTGQLSGAPGPHPCSGTADGGQPETGPSDLNLPEALLVQGGSPTSRTSLATLRVPAGATDIVVVGSAYVHKGTDCSPVQQTLVAQGATRIERADKASTDGSAAMPDGAAEPDATKADTGEQGDANLDSNTKETQ